MRSEVPGAATIPLAYFATSSAALRDFVKAMQRIPSSAKEARRRADSQLDEAREPEGSSLNGGFQKANNRSPRGLPSPSTTVNGAPTRRSASSPGLPMVAEARMKVGSEPW